MLCNDVAVQSKQWREKCSAAVSVQATELWQQSVACIDDNIVCAVASDNDCLSHSVKLLGMHKTLAAVPNEKGKH